MSEKSKSIGHAKHIPKDAQVIVSIMKDMGITDYEPKVINQLLEFTYRYVTCILDDSKVYANHGKKKLIDLDDVRLAVKMQTEKSFTNPPPREVLIEVAKVKNSTPLPFVKPSYGLRLPPDRYCLMGTNYKFKSMLKKSGRGGNTNTAGGRGYSVVKRPGTLSSLSRPQHITLQKPTIKSVTSPANTITIHQQMKAKIPQVSEMIPVMTAPQPPGNVKSEPNETNKRKHEDDDYDVP
ncbi:transcription initiation factor TFIID subunit 9 [Copidosoma floridanum]|uniref:transcription initiation factor TFIID subunit 9 n=1 Tax=Copidosoma floridanum TaxID=29053 RepID=UPI0006C99820|nr:transcription initiation factor TFIID subunit 9 [Copidosoma floridanum]